MKLLQILLFLQLNLNFSYADNLDSLQVFPHFKVSIVTSEVAGARSLTRSERDILYVGSRGEGIVYRIDYSLPKPQVIKMLIGLNTPNGVVYRNGDLFVLEAHQLVKFPNIEQQFSSKNDFQKQVLLKNLPIGIEHQWKYLAMGPKGNLYLSIGAPCNVCFSNYSAAAQILRYDPDTNSVGLFAEGVRNSMGIDWDPIAKKICFTDNGRDYLGSFSPADELNCASLSAQHFGFPYTHAGDPDPIHYSQLSKMTFKIQEPVVKLRPHAASLGMKFYSGSLFPASFFGRLFVAEHGSYQNKKANLFFQPRLKRLYCAERSEPRISILTRKLDGSWKYQTFIRGFQDSNRRRWARPVDIIVDSKGRLLFSDDFGGRIFMVSPQKAK